MPSFDIVSEIENEEVRNAVVNANKELETRFDFRDVSASFEWTKDETTIKAESETQIEQMVDILRIKLSKRNVDPATMDVSKVLHAGKNYSVKVTFKQGIEQDLAKTINRLIKDSKIKVQASIQGDKIRVTGKKRDDLQEVMALLRAQELDQPLQFNNFRD